MTYTFKVAGMTCNHCIKSVEEVIKLLPVEKYDVNIGFLYVEYDTVKVSKEEIMNAIKDIGYEITNND